MAIRCSACRKWLVSIGNLPDAVGVVDCGCDKHKRIHYWRMPAYHKSRRTVQAESATFDMDATCLHHPAKKAVSACDACGAFICALCQVEDKGQSFCLTCFSKGQSKQLKRTDTKASKNVLYDDIALSLAVLPLLLFYFTIFTAPISLYYVIRHWNKHPTSILPRTRMRFILAGIFSSVQIIAWIGVAAAIIFSI